MEDLPTAWRGYDKLPIRAKFFAKKGKGLVGMTGKFHLEWGEFGGFKYIGEAEYDCDYIFTSEKLEGLPNAPMLCKYPGHRVATEGEVYANFITPYFSRTYSHFYGHKNTPHNKASKL